MSRMEKVIAGIETLDQAIKDFNNWGHAAMLYYNKEEGYFNTEVFANDVQASQTILSDGCFSILSKEDRQSVSLGQKSREYIIEFVELVLDGWGPHQAEYHLAHKYPFRI